MGLSDQGSKLQQLYGEIKGNLDKSEKILICINNRSSYDTHSAALALFFTLKDLKKNVSVYICGNLALRHANLFREYDVKYETTLKPMNYVITLDHEDGAIEKVSFDDKDGKFQLYLTPSKDGKEFDFSKVSYSYGGDKFDLIFVFGARSLNWLGDAIKANKATFENARIVNINNLEGSQEFGNYKLVDPQVPVSELVFGLVKKGLSGSVSKTIDLLLRGVIDHLQLQQKSSYKISSVETLYDLVKSGADLKEAISAINNYLDWSNFKLAKKVMNNVKFDSESGLAWSVVNAFDISQCGVNKNNFLLGNRIIFNVSGLFKLVFVLYEIQNAEVWVEFEANDRKTNLRKLLSEYNPVGNGARVTFIVKDKSAAELEEEILELLRRKLSIKGFVPVSNGDNVNGQAGSIVNESADKDEESGRSSETLTKEQDKGDNLDSGASDEDSSGLVVPPPVTPGDPTS